MRASSVLGPEAHRPAAISADNVAHQERRAAHASEILLYTLMFILLLVGWGMLSAGRYPIVMIGRRHLPPILPASPMLYAVLRKAHTILAYLLFATFLAHLSAGSGRRKGMEEEKGTSRILRLSMPPVSNAQSPFPSDRLHLCLSVSSASPGGGE
jgi:hypothetical protein